MDYNYDRDHYDPETDTWAQDGIYHPWGLIAAVVISGVFLGSLLLLLL